MFLDVLLLQYCRTKIYENLQVLLLKRTSSHVSLVKFANLTIWIAKCAHCYFCFILRLTRWRWPVIMGRRS